jgi:FSR family fosmidomycin resistance protein-like MFS transporter
MRTWTLIRRLRPASGFVVTLLAIELLDELVFGAREAAWPLIRDDLALSYAQVGILLGLPGFIASLIEPAIGILGDVWKRRVLVLGGGVAFALGLLLVGLSQSFGLLLAAFILLYPASGAFVSLSQAALMDRDPSRHEHNMARWTLAGSLGVVLGPLALGVAVGVGLGWQGAFLTLALLTLVALAAACRFPFPNGVQDEDERIGFRDGLRQALAALKRREVQRWLILLQFSDLMLDILLGYLALYFVDVVGVGETEAGIAVAVWTGIGLIGDVLLIPLLERVRGLTYLRFSAALVLVLFPAFLLAEGMILKLAILGLLGFFNSGWYSILQGQLYSAMPGQSGAVLAVNNIVGLVGSLVPLAIGLAAQQFGLGAAIWLLLLGPIALLVGLPRRRKLANS